MARTQVKEREAPLPGFEQAPAKPAAKAKAAAVVAKPAKPAKPGKVASKEVAVHKPQPQRAPTSVLELCMMAARDKSIPADRVRAFLEIARDEERHEAEILFDEAMLAAQSEMPPIPRDAYNKHTKSWWARIEGVAAKVDPIARKHGFTFMHGVGAQRIEDHYHLFVDVTWSGKLASGKKVSFTKRYDADIGRDDKGPKGEGTKSLAQGSGSSITYGRRFLKLMVFDAQVLGMDRDGNRPVGLDVISPEQLKAFRKELQEVKIGEDVVCDVYKIDKLENLAVADVASLQQRIQMRRDVA